MKLPPLNALKAFEATARNGTIAAAASELGVSPAAVSMQVRKFENFFNKTLFLRKNNSILLTDAGRIIYTQMTEALFNIAETTERILDQDVRAGLVISTIQSLSERWLAPIVTSFSDSHPEVGIQVRIDTDPVDFVGERIDLRVTYGDQFYPTGQSTWLFHDHVTPLCAPDFMARHAAGDRLVDIPDEKLIRIEWGRSYASYPTWEEWFRRADTPRALDNRKGIRVGGAGIAIAFAVRGAGAMLGSRRLAQQEIKAGLLVAPSDMSLAFAQPYRVVLPSDLSGEQYGTQASRTFLDYLMTSV